MGDFPSVGHIEKGFAGDEHFVDISVTTPNQSLGLQAINVSLPMGASIVSAIAIAVIQIMNNAATAQKVDLDLEVDGTPVFSQNGVIGFPAADGASGPFSIIQDVSAIVTSVGNHNLEGKTTLADGHSTHFTTQYALIVIYRVN